MELSTGGCPQGWLVGPRVGTVVDMRGWWQDLTDLVLPAECGGCGRPRTVLCPECRAALYGAVPGRVRPVLPSNVRLIPLQPKYLMRQKIVVCFLRTRERDPNLLALLAASRIHSQSGQKPPSPSRA